MGLARRQFLEMVSASLLGWQVMSYSQIAQAADLYGNNLSQPTKRKLALLIGINQYDAKGDWLPLNGCVTDVELQQELLVHRFGFKPADIVTLTDRAATKAAIAQAFTEHLIAQALPGDVVVIHFSGHGSRVRQNNTLIPADGGMPGAGLVVNDLMDDTMMLWLQAIATERTICILDAGHYYPGKPVVGNFRIRTRPSQRDWQLSPEELDLQQSLKAQIGNRQGLGQEAKSSNKVTAPGIVLRATSNDLLCADAQWPGFSSGVFTYALTQQLWQVTPATSLHVVLGNVNSTLEQKAFQPDLAPKKQLTIYSLLPLLQLKEILTGLKE
jgi:Caspase domain